MKNMAEAVVKSRDLLEEKTDDLPKDIQMVPLLQAIMRYFKGCIKKKSATESGDPKPVKIKQVYSIRDVIRILFKMKFPTIQAISATLAVTSGRSKKYDQK